MSTRGELQEPFVFARREEASYEMLRRMSNGTEAEESAKRGTQTQTYVRKEHPDSD